KRCWRLICHGRKTLRELVNRKRFQSQQDFGAFFNILCYWALTIQLIFFIFTNKKPHEINVFRQRISCGFVNFGLFAQPLLFY
ncbi:hypothetical protein NF408_09110, partial [Streptococcus suis]|nr:hypothetical protein [Streptococcus suis]